MFRPDCSFVAFTGENGNDCLLGLLLYLLLCFEEILYRAMVTLQKVSKKILVEMRRLAHQELYPTGNPMVADLPSSD